MAFFFNGSTHVISRADALIQTWPLTMHGRIRLTASNDLLVHTILGILETSSNNGFRITVEGNGGTDQRQVCERLREVTELLTGESDFLGVQPEVVRIRQHLLEYDACLCQPVSLRESIDVPEGAERERAFVTI